MAFDASLIGVVFSVILFIIFFSAITLYLSFRIKETFREEKKRSSTVIKVVFLIGVLFLAGGSFYFFATTLQNMNDPTPNPGTTPVLSLTLSYPSTAKMNAKFAVTFTVINPTTATAHGATIQAPVLFSNFVIQSSTHSVVGNVINVGDVPPGTTIVSVELSSPSKAGTVADTVSLLYKESTAPVNQEISISVRGGQ